MPFPLDVPENVYKENNRWIRFCPKCSVKISHLRRNYCIGAHNIEQPCKRCSNVSNHPQGFVGAVRNSWFYGFMKSAITRGYNWEITIEYIDDLYNRQNGKCALSGIDVSWKGTRTASIDRIDNSKGYTEDNVQIVHKKINMMRGVLTVEEFKEFCKLVAHNS